jgi:hypothetical protein
MIEAADRENRHTAGRDAIHHRTVLIEDGFSSQMLGQLKTIAYAKVVGIEYLENGFLCSG